MKPLALVLSALVLVLAVPPVAAQDTRVLTDPDGTPVTIARDDYGVPHIQAETEAALFFGQGFAMAADRLFQMEQFRRAALGRLSELDPTQLEADIQVRTVFYTEAERAAQVEALSEPVAAMYEAFVAGVNTYLDSMATDPARFKPIEFGQVPDPEPWTVTQAAAVSQLFMRQFGQYGGQELTRLAELQAQGQAWFDEHRPINDPDAPTTIRGGTVSREAAWPDTGLRVRLEAVQRLERRHERVEQQRREAGLPPTLGSFAVLAAPGKTADGAMLLGAPQLGKHVRQDEPSRAWESELEAPTLHVAGMTLPGLPGVLVGRTEHAAWSLTSGNSDNTDVFVETVPNGTFDVYLFDGEERPFELRQETFHPAGQEAVTVTVARTLHGPVIGEDLANNQAFTWQMTFWNQELDMAEAFYEMWKAGDLAAFEAALPTIPMSFNVFYVDAEEHTRYWHVGHYPARALDPRLPRPGDGSAEWPALLPFDALPYATGAQQDYFVNWNNKPAVGWDNGDNIPWSTTFRPERTLRVDRIDAVVAPLTDVTFADLKDVPRRIDTTGTYQMAVAFLADTVRSESVLPPGQSAFVSLAGVPSPHRADQWPLHVDGAFKPMRFGVDVGSATEAGGAGHGMLHLGTAYPHPVGDRAEVAIVLPRPGRVQVALFDVLGRRVALLADERRAAGRHTVPLDARALPAGLYLLRLRGPDGGVRTRPLVHVR